MKTALIFSGLLLATSISLAQKTELRISGGLGIPKGGVPVSDYDEVSSSSYVGYNYTYSDSRNNVQDHYFSMGQGTRFEGEFILYVQEHIGIFVESGYSWGSQQQRNSYTSISQSPGMAPTSSVYTSQDRLNFSYIPIVVGFHARFDAGIVQPFIGMGAGLFFASKLTDASVSVEPWSSNPSMSSTRFDQEQKLTTNTPIGYTGYVGVNVALSNSVSMFVEGKATLVSFYVTQLEVMKYQRDGVDQMSTLMRNEKVTTFEANKNYTRNQSTSTDEPSFGGPPPALGANSVGLTIGLSIAL